MFAQLDGGAVEGLTCLDVGHSGVDDGGIGRQDHRGMDLGALVVDVHGVQIVIGLDRRIGDDDRVDDLILVEDLDQSPDPGVLDMLHGDLDLRLDEGIAVQTCLLGCLEKEFTLDQMIEEYALTLGRLEAGPLVWRYEFEFALQGLVGYLDVADSGQDDHGRVGTGRLHAGSSASGSDCNGKGGQTEKDPHTAPPCWSQLSRSTSSGRPYAMKPLASSSRAVSTGLSGLAPSISGGAPAFRCRTLFAAASASRY